MPADNEVVGGVGCGMGGVRTQRASSRATARTALAYLAATWLIKFRHPYWILAAVCLLGLMSTVGVSMPYPILAPIFVGGLVDAFTHFGGPKPTVLIPIHWMVGTAMERLLSGDEIRIFDCRFGQEAATTLGRPALEAGSRRGQLSGKLTTHDTRKTLSRGAQQVSRNLRGC